MLYLHNYNFQLLVLQCWPYRQKVDKGAKKGDLRGLTHEYYEKPGVFGGFIDGQSITKSGKDDLRVDSRDEWG